MELLIMVAILATLLSFLSPSLKKALDTAESVNCQSLIRNQLLATSLYL
ncbi:MAG: type II secretion system protein, partial [Planctomycetes bacterium]|nr:type II secretion system protein [Planctomycetota bacterium]